MAAADGFPKATFTFHHEGPIGLSDFNEALTRLSSRYGRLARSKGGLEESKIYISEIRQGSIEIDFVSLGLAAQAVMSSVGTANTIIDFAKSVSQLLGVFAFGDPSGDHISITDCDDARAIVKPVINTDNGGLTIVVSGDNNLIQPVFANIDQGMAQVIDNRAAMLRAELGRVIERTVRQVLFVWHQVRDVPASEQVKGTPDRGVIVSIDAVPRSVAFAEAGIKERMIHSDMNPFGHAFVVDAKVLFGPNGPTAYLIQKLYDVIEFQRPDQGALPGT